MTSYTRDSDDVIKFFILLRGSVLEYHPTRFGGDWTINKGEREEMSTPQAYILPKYPSLNRIKVQEEPLETHSGTIQGSQIKLSTVIVLLKAYQNTVQKEIFRNFTYDVTMRSLLIKNGKFRT